MARSRILAARIGAVTLALTLAFSAGGATVLAADPPTTTDPGAAASGWIAIQVEAGGAGPGSLADAIFAYASTGVGADAAAAALTKLEAVVDSFIVDGSSNLIAGAVAKTLLAVQVAGGDPTSFGGHDLETELRGLINTTAGPDLGRFGTGLTSDQAYAVIALARTSGGVPSDAVDYLVSLQCANGDFQWDGSCPAGPGSEDPDTTGLALQALLAAGATAAATTTTQLLLDIQGSDGAFSSFGTPNTNSSGVAGQALRAAGEPDAADDAKAFINSVQFGCSAPAADRGAYPWAVSSPGFLIFSTPQAVLALGGASLEDLTIAGAADDAPILACQASGGGGNPSPRPTGPPTDAVVSEPVTDAAATPLLLLILIAVTGGAALSTRRWVGRRP